MDPRIVRKRIAMLLFALATVHPLQGAGVPLGLLFYDRNKLLGEYREEFEAEVEDILGTAGVRVRWLSTNESLETNDRMLLRANLLEREPDYLLLKNSVMGVTTEEGGGHIFIFYPPILRTLGVDRDGLYGKSRLQARLRARAIGRVLVHEIVHFLCPDQPHAKAGLMKAHWTRRLLVEPGVRLDAASEQAVLQGLMARLPESGKLETR